MAVTYVSGDRKQVMCAVDGTVAIAKGDLLYLDTDDVKPFSNLGDSGTKAQNQAAAHDLFIGIAGRSSASGATQPIPVATGGVFEFDSATATYEVGALVGAAGTGGSGAVGVSNSTIEAVATDNLAIGKVVRRGTDVVRAQVAIRSVILAQPSNTSTTTDTISESTPAAGVTVDGVLLKDAVVTATGVDAGASGTAGSVDVFPTTASKGKLAITCTDQTGDTTVSLVAGAMAAARTITIPDPGAAASVLMSTGTATATDATSAELTRAADMSARVVTLSTTPISITEAAHEGRVMYITKTDGIAITLPVPAAGMRYTFVVGATIASASSIKSVAGTQLMIGYALMSNDSDNTVVRWPALAASTYDTIDLLGTANSTGGIEGQIIRITGLSTTRWHVEIIGDAAGTEATPFADTVA